ncbi:MAG: hypothetical protein ABSH01_07090 [Terriglobia bacterium]|jgi:hypothetical protein
MADRSTSFAKSVEGLHHEESALERARSLKEQFVRAQNDNQKQKETEAEKPPAGSQMVREDAPVLRPTPSGPMRQTPDRYAAATKLGKERDNADARIEAARKAQEAFKARQGKSHDHERDRER